MANPEHLKILKQGVEVWNRWREENPGIRPDLQKVDFMGEDLRNANLELVNLRRANLQDSDLQGANLKATHLWQANLRGVTFRSATMTAANLELADLWHADLSYAHLRVANLQRAGLGAATLESARLQRVNFWGADLRRAKLRGSDLQGAHFHTVNLQEADFSDAVFSATSIGNGDLSQPFGLDRIRHSGPSTIGVDTLMITASSLAKDPSRLHEVESFLRGSGIDEEYLNLFRSYTSNPIEFYSGFISYSHVDTSFARRLHDQLQARGIRCWLDEHDMKPGDRILDVVNDAIRLHDKILLCCSESSLNSWWVKDEIRKAQDRERKENRLIIIPLNLDGYLFEWDDGLASDLTTRLAADFTGWEHDNAKFEEQFERVVKALRTHERAREKAPHS